MTSTRQAVFYTFTGVGVLWRGVTFAVALVIGMALTAPATLAADPDASAEEGDTMTFKLDMPYGSTQESYRWTCGTQDGTATTDDGDYTSTTDVKVTFNDNYDGDWVEYVQVSTAKDCDTNEGDESFTLKCTDMQVKNEGTNGWATVTGSYFSDPDWAVTFTRDGKITDGEAGSDC